LSNRTRCRSWFKAGRKFWDREVVPEACFPYTHINKTFVGDRYSECNPPLIIPPHADFISQCPDDYLVEMKA
jgi:hypothetical protein